MEMGETTGKSIRYEHFWDFAILGVLFASPSGKVHFRKKKTHPKRKIKRKKTRKFLSNQITARSKPISAAAVPFKEGPAVFVGTPYTYIHHHWVWAQTK